MWFWIARTLGKSVSEAKSSVTATEFLRWQEVRKEEEERTTKEHHYFARLTYHVYLLRHALSFSNVKTLPTEDDFLLKFEVVRKSAPDRSKVSEPTVDEDKVKKEQEIRLQNSKAFWLAGTGALMGDKFPVRVPPKKQ